jgi:hypothetical protein
MVGDDTGSLGLTYGSWTGGRGDFGQKGFLIDYCAFFQTNGIESDRWPDDVYVEKGETPIKIQNARSPRLPVSSPTTVLVGRTRA